MTLDEYECHLIGRLCWRCHQATHPSSGRQRQCPRCRAKWSYHRRKIDRELLRAFGLNATAHHVARVVRCSYPTAYAAYTQFRFALQAITAEEKRLLLGESELDESYFGGKRKGKRGRGAGGKVAVFGVLERAGRVDTVVVPNCFKETLMGKLRDATVKGGEFYTDEFTSYNGVRSHGKHVPINRQETFGVGKAHINGIEGFWSFAKRLYRHVHGVDPERFPLYLAEYEFRYNHRGEHLATLLYDRLIRPTIPNTTPP